MNAKALQELKRFHATSIETWVWERKTKQYAERYAALPDGSPGGAAAAFRRLRIIREAAGKKR